MKGSHIYYKPNDVGELPESRLTKQMLAFPRCPQPTTAIVTGAPTLIDELAVVSLTLESFILIDFFQMFLVFETNIDISCNLEAAVHSWRSVRGYESCQLLFACPAFFLVSSKRLRGKQASQNTSLFINQLRNVQNLFIDRLYPHHRFIPLTTNGQFYWQPKVR